MLYAMRDFAFVADPDMADAPVRVEDHVSDAVIDKLAKRIDRKKHRPNSGPSAAGSRKLRHGRASRSSTAGVTLSPTPTLDSDFGSGVVVAGAGFLLSNEMDDFSAKAGVPNAYGLLGGDANAIQPGKRMLSSMSPALLLDRDGRVALVVGSMGGSTIISGVFQVLVDVVGYRLSAQRRCRAGISSSGVRRSISLTWDGAFAAARLAALQPRGYALQPHDWPLGAVQSSFALGLAGILRPTRAAAAECAGCRSRTVNVVTASPVKAGCFCAVADLMHWRIFRPLRLILQGFYLTRRFVDLALRLDHNRMNRKTFLHSRGL